MDAYISHLEDNGLWSSYIHTYDESMKARPKGHIAVKCGMQKRILKLRQKIVVTDNATPLRFVIIVPIIGKT